MANIINSRMTKDRKYLCHTYREANLNLTVPEPEEWKRTNIARAAIQQYRLSPLVSIEDTMAFIEKEMGRVPSVSATTLDTQTDQIKAIVLRALEFDGRRWNNGYPKEFEFAGQIIKARPDYWIESEVEVDGNTYPLIEVNCLSAGKPQFGTTPRTGKMDNLYHNLSALGNLLYGKSLLGNREGIVKVEYDYLKTSKDKSGDYTKPFTEAFSSTSFTKTGENNRAWIEVWFSKEGVVLPKERLVSNEKNTNLFRNYEASLEVFLQGLSPEDVPKGICEKCELFDRCKGFSKRPEPKQVQEDSDNVMSRNDFILSHEQRRVISARDGSYCVDAGPGSGKTFSVALRIADMIAEGAKPEDFLLLSFSKAAVEVMRERVAYFVNKVYKMDMDLSRIFIATFNSLGDIIIRENYKALGFSKEPQLIDDVENIDIIRKAIDWDAPIDGFDYNYPLMRFGTGGVIPMLENIFENIRQFNWNKKDFQNNWKKENGEKIWETYERYAAILKTGNWIDYSDQSNLVKELIIRDQTLITERFNFEHIIVDEFQDSNDFQMLFVNCLTNAPKHKSLMVIGDERQAIYGFRGTSPDNLIHFDERMSIGGVKKYTLTINRRSTPEIVNLSNQVISLNSEDHKDMTSDNPSGSTPKWKAFEKGSAELPWVADEIEKLLVNGTKPSDIAFIAHKKSSLSKLQGLLAERNILALYDQPEEMLSDSKVKAALSLSDFLRDNTSTKGVFDYLCEVYGNDFISNPECNTIVEREAYNIRRVLSIPSDDQTKKTLFINLLKALDDGTDNLYRAFIERVEGKTSYNTFQLLDYLYKFRKYESRSTADKGEEYEAIALVTAHSSKGKEWKHVFVSLSDFDSALTESDDMSEKIRLAYVAITRAEEELTVTCAKYGKSDGDIVLTNRFYDMFHELDGFEDITPKALADLTA